MKNQALEKLMTGIPGLDQISRGGLPKGRATLLAGTAGSAKTVLAVQFLVHGIVDFNQPGVFATFEESPEDIRRNMRGFGWDIEKWEEDKLWKFIDFSRTSGEETVAGDFDFGGLIARLKNGVKKFGASRLVLDSIGSIFSKFEQASVVRRELYLLGEALKEIGVTSIVTTERLQEYGEISRFGVEEFVADNVILLRNVLEQEKRRRTVEILKFRGTDHLKGESPFTIVPSNGLALLPLSSMELTQRSSTRRITSGITELDEMCGGGFLQDSMILVSGATGTGKSLMTTHFMKSTSENERALLFGFEESRDQMIRNAAGWGFDFEKLCNEGRLKIVCSYPETAALEDHLFAMKSAVKEFKPTRVAIDSLSALERISVQKNFRDFVLSMTSFLKENEIAGLFTAATVSLLGGDSVTEAHISTLTDSIILLRYVEMFGEMQRGLTVLKMRGSAHDKDIRRYSIDQEGMHIGPPFVNVSGVLSGAAVYVPQTEVDRIRRMTEIET